MTTSSFNQDELLQLPAMIDLATAARALGVGRTKAYDLAKSNAFPCPVLRIGTSYRVLTADLLRLVGVDRQPTTTRDGSPDRTDGRYADR
ncbi:helix-turn-helix domain-containing protein [Micromonospora zamorensis]|uniref:helix-turn-helix transcriptional regulator n=1 Tax=Micromonospora zamorensis TaxID=709883 RepID=UPI003867F667|nr:helix-turn-helix domain-containing protein [Micromonospora zamorensis]